MLLKIFTFSLLITSLYCDKLTINDKFIPFSLPDQFDRIHTIKSNISKIIVSFDEDTSKLINEYLFKKEYKFLYKHRTIFISDISNNSSLITKMFILPKMRDYKHTILVIYDNKGEKFLRKIHKATIYSLNHGVVNNIKYISSKKQLEEIFNHE